MSDTIAPQSAAIPEGQWPIPPLVSSLIHIKGQIVRIETERDCKMRAGQPMVRKSSVFLCRVGVDYENMKSTKEGRADGSLPAENAGLPWGRWMIFPYVIEHKGEVYFRMTTMPGAKRWSPSYTRNGKQISADEAKVVCLGSEFTEKENTVFTVKIGSILKINGVSVTAATEAIAPAEKGLQEH